MQSSANCLTINLLVLCNIRARVCDRPTDGSDRHRMTAYPAALCIRVAQLNTLSSFDNFAVLHGIDWLSVSFGLIGYACRILKRGIECAMAGKIQKY